MLLFSSYAEGLAEHLCANKYDAIVATYSLHHLTDAQKGQGIQDTRDRAYQLFAEKGFKEVTMKDLCERSGNTAG